MLKINKPFSCNSIGLLSVLQAVEGNCKCVEKKQNMANSRKLQKNLRGKEVFETQWKKRYRDFILGSPTRQHFWKVSECIDQTYFQLFGKLSSTKIIEDLMLSRSIQSNIFWHYTWRYWLPRWQGPCSLCSWNKSETFSIKIRKSIIICLMNCTTSVMMDIMSQFNGNILVTTD